MSISKEKFTPGPWVKLNITGMPEQKRIVNKNGFIIADMGVDDTGQITDEQKEANAQLSSASTEMYQIIKQLYEFAHDNQIFGPNYPAVEKAYKKALGIIG